MRETAQTEKKTTDRVSDINRKQWGSDSLMSKYWAKKKEKKNPKQQQLMYVRIYIFSSTDGFLAKTLDCKP